MEEKEGPYGHERMKIKRLGYQPPYGSAGVRACRTFVEHGQRRGAPRDVLEDRVRRPDLAPLGFRRDVWKVRVVSCSGICIVALLMVRRLKHTSLVTTV